MSPRTAAQKAADRPFAKPATVGSADAPVWRPTDTPGCELPPPPDWPPALKLLVKPAYTPLGVSRPGTYEPMWLALRTIGSTIRGGAIWKVITNEEAWTLCIEKLARSRQAGAIADESAA